MHLPQGYAIKYKCEGGNTGCSYLHICKERCITSLMLFDLNHFIALPRQKLDLKITQLTTSQNRPVF